MGVLAVGGSSEVSLSEGMTIGAVGVSSILVGLKGCPEHVVVK